MGKNKTALIILIAALGLGLAVYLWYSNIEKPKHNWHESYKNDNKEPYGTFIISEMLEKYFPYKKFTVMRKPIHEGLPHRSTEMNYVFIGSGMYLDSLSEIKLLDFVSKGNNAFISISDIPYFLEDTLEMNTCEYYYAIEFESDTIAHLNFFNQSFKADEPYPYIFQYINDTVRYSWSYFVDTCVRANSSVDYYANLNDTLPNFASVQFGKGYFYFHIAPLVFTNFQMLNKRSVEYAGKVFSYLPEGDIYWDEFSKIPIEYKDEGGQLKWQKSPLYFILSQPALRIAWYLIIALVLLFVLFRAKRRQRIIPVLVPNTNTSLEFAETIGRIYYLQNDHKKLASQKMKLFLEYIRNRYGISTNTIDEQFFLKLSQKSQVPKNEVEKLFESFKAIDYLKEISENLLITFNQSIDNFYKKAK